MADSVTMTAILKKKRPDEDEIIEGEFSEDDEASEGTDMGEDEQQEAEYLQLLVNYYEDYVDASFEARELSENDRNFYDGNQWTSDEIDALKRRRQPIITINRIAPKINALIGIEMQMRTDPKAFPRTPVHDKDAESVTDAIRYVCDNNDWDQKRSDGRENMYIEGVCGYEIAVEAVRNQPEIKINRLHWDRIFYDPHSREKDFSDAKYKGIVIWMDLDDAMIEFPGYEEQLERTVADSTSLDYTFDDKPTIMWGDRNRQRVRICQICFLHKGVWKTATYTRGGLLSKVTPSPYKDENGEPMCNIELQSAFVDREGNRYGVMRNWISPQQEINKRRSKSLHLLSVRQTQAEAGAVTDVKTMKAELAKPDGHVETVPGKKIDVLDTGDMASGQFELLAEAKQEIDAVGVNAALSGKESRDLSGKAIKQLAQGGQVELGPVFDAGKALDKRVYRQVWARVKQFWTGQRWVRVTDNQENLRWVQLNKRVTVRDVITEKFGHVPPQYENDPRLDTVVRIDNHLAQLDVDIIIDESPDVVTIQQEQFELVSEMFRAAPDKVPFEAVVELSNLRNKESFLEKINGSKESQQANAQAQQQAQQLEMADKQADVEKKKASAAKDRAYAVEKAVEAAIKRTDHAMPQLKQLDNPQPQGQPQGQPRAPQPQ